MKQDKRNKAATILGITAGVAFINFFLSLYPGIYDQLGYSALMDICLTSLAASFMIFCFCGWCEKEAFSGLTCLNSKYHRDWVFDLD